MVPRQTVRNGYSPCGFRLPPPYSSRRFPYSQAAPLPPLPGLRPRRRSTLRPHTVRSMWILLLHPLICRCSILPHADALLFRRKAVSHSILLHGYARDTLPVRKPEPIPSGSTRPHADVLHFLPARKPDWIRSGSIHLHAGVRRLPLVRSSKRRCSIHPHADALPSRTWVLRL